MPDRVAEHQRLASSLCCRELSVQFGDASPAIDSITWEFAAGKVTSLVGKSGCGKTTLLRSLARLQMPTSGHIEVTPPISTQCGEIAFVFQQPTLLPWRTAIENVMLPIQLGLGHRDSSVSADSSAKHLAARGLASMELDETAWHRYPHELSGGMKMRVSLARALVTEPSILLLDEPFAALDDMLRLTLSELLMRRWEHQQCTMVMVTHHIAEAAMLSHQIVLMQRGRIANVIDNQLPRPRDEAVRTSNAFGELYREISQSLRGDGVAI